MYKKVLRVILILIIFTIILSCQVFAMQASDLAPKYPASSGNFLQVGKLVMGWIRNITAVSLVVLLAFIGLRFMFGSLEQRAEYKKALMPLLIGSLVVLSATTITSMVWNTGTQTACSHKFEGSGYCGEGNRTCVKCGFVPTTHNYKFRTYGTGGQGSKWYQCEYCGKSLSVEEYENLMN